MLKEKYFYEKLFLDDIKPTVIDYETVEYKTIINKLSNLNKKVVLQNRKINKLLDLGKHISSNDKLMKGNSKVIGNACQELESLVSEVGRLRRELDLIKDENHAKNNINRTKVNYIKEAIDNGTFQKNNDKIVLDSYSLKDNHRTFHIELSLKELNDILFCEENVNTRINFYQM